MPVIVKRRLPQIGRIRIGRKGEKGQPVKLSTFRLTSHDRKALDVAAEVYGGSPRPWDGFAGQWELVTKVSELPIMIAPERPSQWYELWSAGGCQKRCDGTTCTVPDGKGGLKEQDCTCDPDHRACKLVTRASFLLPDLPALGVWRFDSSSIYVAMELPGMIEVLSAAREQRRIPEAVLAIEVRRAVRQNAKGQPETRVYPVVTIRIRETLREALASGAAQAAIPAPVPELPAAAEVLEPADDQQDYVEPDATVQEMAVAPGVLIDAPAH